MPSFLNPHPFRTSTTPKKSPPQQPPKLSSAHIDLWEHAALLYHHFEWHSAIETFQHLFHTLPTSSAEARTRCLLNAGIIQARLGDYALADQTLEDAARTDAEFVLTPFLLGIVEWELGNLIKAEACLEISLVALRRYRGEGEVGVQRYGVGFMLREEVVRELLERLRGVDPLSERAQSTIVGFAVLEAEFIFEAPAREDGLVGELLDRRLEDREVVSAGKTSISRQPEHLSDSSPKLAVKNPRETFQDLKSFLRGHKPIPSPNPTTRAVPPPDPPNSHPSHPPTATAEATYHSTWRRRPPTPYIPRDARGEYHSVGELVRFIRRYQNQLGPMAPRDPRGEAESTGELARFIRCAGREGGEVVAGLRMPFLDGEETGGLVAAGEVESLLDLYLVREDVGDIIVGGGGGGGGGGNGGETGGGGGGIARRYSDPIPAHTATTDVTGGMERQILTDPNTPTSSHFPSSSFKDDENSASDETIRLLLPKVYEGTPTMTNNIPSLQLLDLSPPRHPTEQEDNPLANFHTAGSETSSLFRQSMLTIERAQVARSEALRRLEGRARVDMKPLRMGVRRGVGAGRGGKRQREGGEEGMGRAERLRNGRTDEGRGEGNGGSVPTIISTAPPTAVVGTVDPVPNLLNGKLDGKGIAAPTKTTTTKGKAKFLLPSHSKPLPPGPPLGKAGRFEVFLTDGYLDRSPLLGKAGRFEVFLGDEYPDRREDGVKAGNAGVGGDEEKEEEGNAVRVPSSKIFEYMSRG
ncbi:hypothetical protein KC338_g6084 [Hortaea werneckii]|nr:hypothetical protein KC338_g6084 [Hortaea werneckii]